MNVLLGSTRSGDLLRRMRVLGWGRLFAGETPKPHAGEPWALDNGVFGAWRAGRAWNPTPFMTGVLRACGLRGGARPLAPPLFVVLPDLVADAASLDYSMAWLDRHACFGDLPWFLVLQNGMRHDDAARVLRVRQEIAGLFLGGDDGFKLSARGWCDLAHAHGRRFHFARASTPDRLREAHAMGADSCDTTQPLWSESAFARFERTYRELEASP